MALSFGIVSTGRWPDRKMAPTINATQEAELVAVYSRDMAQAQAFARKHGAPTAYDSYEAMLEDPQVEAVYVASPNFLHAEHTVKAALAGKHVLCEKPMAVSVEEARTMVETCQSQGVKLGVCFHLRHHPGYKEIRRLVQAGALGTSSLVQAQWGAGERGQVFPASLTGRMAWWDQPEAVGGASIMMAMGVHEIDILRYVLGQEVTEIAAMTDGQVEARPLEHLNTMLLRFQDGTIGMVYATRRTPEPQNHLILHGSEGRIAFYNSLYAVLQGQLEVRTSREEKTMTYERADMALYVNMVNAFCRAVAQDREPSASGWDGLRVVQVTLAMLESAKTGRRIRLASH